MALSRFRSCLMLAGLVVGYKLAVWCGFYCGFLTVHPVLDFGDIDPTTLCITWRSSSTRRLFEHLWIFPDASVQPASSTEPVPDMNLTATFAAVKIPGWRHDLVLLIYIGGNICAAKFDRLWLLEVGVAFLLVKMSGGERLHSRLSWRLRLRLQLQFPRSMAIIGVNLIAVDVVSASTPWTPTLIPASNDVDANFSDLHALQSQKFRKQGNSPIGELSPNAMASRGRRGGASACEDEPRRDERAEQQAPAPQCSVLPPPPPVDYGVFMQGLVQAMQTQAHTQAALQA
ncbi:hypothetical protein Taro_045992 [Colocasia esculenta]|uniref:Uncharacterized protein n=1 Tax=Colocasia esculenta TaxID=4460 RepID=A0A843X3J5_COLES|nr:hypothetical protein [Colocasia esculenta]